MATRRQQFLNPGAFKRSWQNIVKNCLKDIVKYLFQNMTLRGIKPCHQNNRVVFNKIQFVQIAIRTFLVYCPKEFDDSVEVSRWQNIPRYLYDCIILFYSMVSRLYPSINKTVVVWEKGFSEPHGCIWYWADTELLHWALAQILRLLQDKQPRSLWDHQKEKEGNTGINKTGNKKIQGPTSEASTCILYCYS